MSTEPIDPEVVETESVLVPLAPSAFELIERSQLDILIETAKRHPRPEIARIRQRMLTYATVDDETAESCIYSVPRWDKETKKNKLIQGPSIRLAEILTASWGNIASGSRVIDSNGRKVVAQGICIDFENNVRVSAEAARRIVDKDGRPYSDDMQIVTGQAACAIARRNAVFQVVPFALIKPVYSQILKQLAGDASSLTEKRDKLFARFYQMGVKKDQILAVLGKQSEESVDLEDVGLLIGLGTAIKDKEITVKEAFTIEPAEEGEEAEAPRSRLREKLAARKAARAAEAEKKS